MGTDALRALVASLCAAAVMVAAADVGAQEAPARTVEDVQFEPDDASLTLLAQTGEVPVERMIRLGRGWYRERGMAPRYAAVCEGPCAMRFEAGEYRLALAKAGGGAVETGAVHIAGPVTIRAHYEDHHAARLLGAILGIAGTIAGAILIAASVHPSTLCDTAGDCYGHETVNGGVMAAGIGVVVGSVVVGSILVTRHDEASISVSPLSTPASDAPRAPAEAALSVPSVPQGGLLTIRF